MLIQLSYWDVLRNCGTLYYTSVGRFLRLRTFNRKNVQIMFLSLKVQQRSQSAHGTQKQCLVYHEFLYCRYIPSLCAGSFF